MISDLNIIQPAMPNELINREGFLRLQDIAGNLPLEFSDFWGFECRMHRHEPLADILFEIKKDSLGQRLMAGLEASCLDGLCAEHTAWSNLRSFARQWVDDRGIFSNISNVWLEFDAEKAGSVRDTSSIVKTPCVFIGLRSKEMTPYARWELFQESSNLLEIPEHIVDDIHAFVQSIPAHGQLFQAGVMLGRASRDIRLCVNHLSPEQVPGWLADMQWPGDADAVHSLLQTLQPMLRAMAVDFNLTAHGPEGKIGLECYLDWDDQQPDQWVRLLDTMDAYHPVHPGKRKGLQRFPGATTLDAEHRKCLPGQVCLSVFRMIHHMKISFEIDQVVGIKAYLAVYKPTISLTDNWYIQE